MAWMNLLRRWRWYCSSLFFLLYCSVVIESLPTPQTFFKACPIQFSPRYFCCDHGNGDKFVYTLYQRPSGDDSFDAIYKDAWHNQPRQVNFPYSMYTPKTPIFHYSNPNEVCRIRRLLRDKKLIEFLQCGSSDNSSLPSLSFNPDLFMTFKGNPRNNNATCPDGATFTSLSLPNGKVNQTLWDQCKSIAKTSQLPYWNSFFDLPFLIFYCFTSWLVLFHCFFIFYVKRSKKKHMLSQKCEKPILLSSSSSSPNRNQLSKQLLSPALPRQQEQQEQQQPFSSSSHPDHEEVQIGLRDDGIGTFLYKTVGCCLPLILILQGILLLDQYHCFGGILLEDGDARFGAYLIVYFLFNLLSIGIVAYSNHIRDFYRVSEPLATCQYVKFILPDTREIHLEDRTGISQWVNKVESFFYTTKSLSQETLVVHQDANQQRYVEFQHLRYLYDEVHLKFLQQHPVQPSTYKELYESHDKMTHLKHQKLQNLVGKNQIELRMPSVLESIMKEFFQFYYIYQLANYLIWFYLKAWYMSIVMSSLAIGIGIFNLFMSRKMQKSVMTMANPSDVFIPVQVLRDGQWSQVASWDLVPGDTIQLQKGNGTLPCDVVLLKGFVICDEAMLTGEAVPVQKVEISSTSNHIYNPNSKQGKMHSLFGGTQIVSLGSTQQQVLGRVIATGPHTTKGQLLRTLIYPVPLKYKYDEHMKVLLMFLLVVALVASYLVTWFLSSNANFKNKLGALGYAVFMIGGIIHPLLKSFILVGQVIAAKRLEKRQVFCLNSSRLALAGKIRVVCFDKTGTMTEKGLEFHGCLPTTITSCCSSSFTTTPNTVEKKVGKTMDQQQGNFSCIPATKYCNHNVSSPNNCNNNLFRKNCNHSEETTTSTSNVVVSREIEFGLSTCHSLGIHTNGKDILGSELEIKMFRATQAILLSNDLIQGKNKETLEIVKKFEFQHHRMSMCVVVRHVEEDQLYVFCKGSYEQIQTVSRKSSIPKDFTLQVEQLAKEGCYILGLAYKKLFPHQLYPSHHDHHQDSSHNGSPLHPYPNGYMDFLNSQDETLVLEHLESDLEFISLLLFRNELHPDAKKTIQELKQGDIRSVMITGDNVMCANYVALQSGMISHNRHLFVAASSVTSSSMDTDPNVYYWKNSTTNHSLSTLEILELIHSNENDTHPIELAIADTPTLEYLMKTREFDRLLLHIRIFARMTPQSKSEVVTRFMNKGLITAMCGDGGNDCQALRKAHVGIALSDAEASLVSPFTSKGGQSLYSVVDICTEGRCSLVTSFSGVKYFVLGGFIASGLRLVQYYNGIIMSELCWTLCSTCNVIGLSFFMARCQPKKTLEAIRPTSSLLGPSFLTSLFGHLVINALFLYCSIRFLTHQPWYCSFSPKDVDLMKWWLLSDNPLATCLFYLIAVQQQTAAVVFSFGGMFRLPIWRNYGLVGFCLLLFSFNVFSILGSSNIITDHFRLALGNNVVGLPNIPIPFDFRKQLFFILLANALCCYILEFTLCNGYLIKYWKRRFYKKHMVIKL